jgi:Xaa-Pro aminopeptidase
MAYAPSALLERRHDTVRQALAGQNLDALVVTSLPNILYLTNFSGSSAIAIVTSTAVVFITDSRYITSIAEMQESAHRCPGLRLHKVDASYDEALVAALSSMAPAAGPLRRAGFEAAHLSVARHAWLSEKLHGVRTLEMISTERIVEEARIVKDAYELEVLREAGRRLSRVATDVVRHEIRAGRSEREVAAAIDQRLHQAGFEKPAFDTIVAAGPNAALPHARPGERKLTEGDMVVLDFGGVYDSYCVDLTRTVVLGRASDRAASVYQAVLRAHDRAIAAVKPGVAPWAIDAAARDSLAADGMAEAFGHGTGHGLGIEVHEEPRVSRRRTDDDRVKGVAPGMVFTIEPGAYFPGWGGVRIEDDVLVTDQGVELLTDAGTELLTIGH